MIINSLIKNGGHKKAILHSSTTARSCLSGQQRMMLAGSFQMRSFMAAATGFDATLAEEMSKLKVAPAAGWWMRSYGVLPS